MYIGNTTAYSIRPSTAGGLGHFIYFEKRTITRPYNNILSTITTARQILTIFIVDITPVSYTHLTLPTIYSV